MYEIILNQERCCLKIVFLFCFLSGSHFVQQRRTISATLVECIMGNICVNLTREEMLCKVKVFRTIHD